jgi:hypothetical protein
MVIELGDSVKAEPTMQVIRMYISLNIILNGELIPAFWYIVGLVE